MGEVRGLPRCKMRLLPKPMGLLPRGDAWHKFKKAGLCLTNATARRPSKRARRGSNIIMKYDGLRTIGLSGASLVGPLSCVQLQISGAP